LAAGDRLVAQLGLTSSRLQIFSAVSLSTPTSGVGHTRPRRPLLGATDARPVLPSKRTHAGRPDRGSLGPEPAVDDLICRAVRPCRERALFTAPGKLHRNRLASFFGKRFWKKSQMGGSRSRTAVPETLRDGRWSRPRRLARPGTAGRLYPASYAALLK